MRRSILVKMWNSSPDDDFITLHTYNRRNHASGYFSITKSRLRSYIESCRENPIPESYLENDWDSNLQARWCGNDWVFRVTWVSRVNDYDIHGFIQYIIIPHSCILKALNGESVRFVYDPDAGKSRIIIRSNHIGEILENPIMKRAFSKAMRDCFQWKNNVTTLYDDWAKCFYFINVDNYGGKINGGLILHKTDHIGNDGISRPAYHYSVHT